MGMALTPTYTWISKWKGLTINILSYPKRAIKMIIISLIIALLINLNGLSFFNKYYKKINIIMIYGISCIPVGKSTLVFSLNPIFWIFLAHFILGEKELPIFSTIGAFIGIYFLTINKPNETDESNNVLIGFIWVFISAWLQAMVMIVVRILNIFQVHPFFRPLLFFPVPPPPYRGGLRGVQERTTAIHRTLFYDSFFNCKIDFSIKLGVSLLWI